MLPTSVPGWGSLALGIFIAYLTWYFVTRFTEFNVAGLSAVAAVVAGGVVVAFLDAGIAPGGVPLEHRWFYPVGLVVGFLVYALFFFIRNRYFPSLTLIPGSSSAPRQP